MSVVMPSCNSIGKIRLIIWLIIQYSFVKKCSAAVLSTGKTLPWNESLLKLLHARRHGVKQFINQYHDARGITDDDPSWGDEVEYAILRSDKLNKRVSLSLRAPEVLDDLRAKQEVVTAAHASRNQEEGCIWHEEYGAWMVEGTPLKPYNGLVTDLHRVESNMRLRRQRILSVLLPNEIAVTMTNFPTLGVLGSPFTTPFTLPGGPIADSEYVSDDIISPGPRFKTLTSNIRARRGKKVNVRVPLFEDDSTPEFKDDKGSPRDVHMDAPAFGMGCCCLQLTFQGRDVGESRYLYDKLLVLSPIMLALSAATPIHRGRLVNTDVRWDVISGTVDDRTPAERREVVEGENSLPIPELAGRGVIRQPKSRYASASRFIYSQQAAASADASNNQSCSANAVQPPQYNHRDGSKCNSGTMLEGDDFNDLDVPFNGNALKLMTSKDIDVPLAKHISHLFSRDPLILSDDEKGVNHFVSLLYTNWQTVRWKPPPAGSQRTGSNDSHIGWRAEFRALEIQLTDFENAAYAVFVFLLTRAILAFNLVLYMPISKVDENMKRATERNAVAEQLFYFRKSVDSGSTNEYILMTIEEILMGRRRGGDADDGYPGLIPLVKSYLELIEADTPTTCLVDRYLELIRKRANGEVLTTASWIRKFVRSHPGYKNDSTITDELAHDLVSACQDIGEGRKSCPELLGHEVIEPIRGLSEQH